MALVIRINDDTIEKLQKLRTHPRETWDDLLKKALEKKEDK